MPEPEPETWITLIGYAVGDERQGFRICHAWEGRRFGTKPEAISNGFAVACSDDFNVGLVRGGGLESVWWMDHKIDEDPETLAEIGREIGLAASRG